MLIKAKFSSVKDPVLELLSAMTAAHGPTAPREVIPGVYEVGHFNMNHELDTAWWIGKPRAGYNKDAEHPALGNIQRFRVGEETVEYGDFGAYGVCDHYQQILDQCPEIVESKTRAFVISLSLVRKVDQSPDGGWRWHKWGEYIGTHEPQCEYLYHEVGIEQVYCFHVYEVLNQQSIDEYVSSTPTK